MSISTQEPTVQELFDLSGKTSLVTGGTGYLGGFLARALAEMGSRVIISSRNTDFAMAAAKSLTDPNGIGHLGIRLDHMDEAQLNEGFKTLLEKVRNVDVLVNNGHEPLTQDWKNVTGSEFTRHLANATGYFLLARLVRNQAVANKLPASIIMLGSMYGVVASYPQAYDGISSASPSAYHVLKGGIVQLTRHLAAYWASDKVRVNCISPGPFPGSSAPRKLVKRLESYVPLGRIGQPHELKASVVFLGSDASTFITGHNLVVDGGWTAW